MALSASENTVLEETTATYRAYLYDDADPPVVIPSANINTLTLTLYNKTTGAIINSRNAQNVLNTNNVTVHATSGLLTWSLQVADTTLVSTTLNPGETEEHVAMFAFAYNTSTKAGKHEFSFLVRNLTKVTDG